QGGRVGNDQFGAHPSPMRRDRNEHDPASRDQVTETAKYVRSTVDTRVTRVMTQSPTIIGAPTTTVPKSPPRLAGGVDASLRASQILDSTARYHDHVNRSQVGSEMLNLSVAS